MAEMTERFIDYRGGRLRYLVGGTGQPLLLAHGFTGSAENFETWFDDLTQMRRLIIPDLPGFGLSTPLTGRHTAASLAGALAAIIEAEEIERFDLGGLCLGACIALALLRQRPHLVDKLILHTPLMEPDLVLPRFHRQARLLTAPGVYPFVVWLARQRRISDWYKRTFTEDADVDDRGAQMNFYNQQRANPRAAKEWLRDGLRRRDSDLLRHRTGDTLVIIASNDKIVDLARLRQLVEPLPEVQLAVFEDAGHGWSEDFVRRQNAVLRAFLEGLALPPTGDSEAA